MENSSVNPKNEFDVKLIHFGDLKLDVIKIVKEITGLSLKEAKQLVESAPKVVKEQVSKEDAEWLIKMLENAGALVELE